MVFARLNSAPPLVRPHVGRTLTVKKCVPYDTYGGSVPDNTAALVRFVHHNYVQVHTKHGTKNIRPDSEFMGLASADAKKARQEIVDSLEISPTGTGRGPTGTDPELFVLHGDGSLFPAFQFLPTKASPIKRYESNHQYDGCHYSLFWDGFQAEFTVNAMFCHALGCDNVRFALRHILKLAQEQDKDAKLTWKPVVDVPQMLLDTSAPEHVRLGCDPSKNAYREGPNEALTGLDPSTLPYRFAGYHIHFGCGKQEEAMYKRMVRLLDAIVGVCSVSLFRGMEDVRRRRFYGLAGEYRTPAHGLEWRTLSSAVLCHPAVWHLVMDLSRVAKTAAEQGYSCLWTATKMEVQEAINTLNASLAQEIIGRNKKSLQLLLGGLYNAKGVESAMRLIREGAANCLPVDDMAANWHLLTDWAPHSNRDKAFLSNTTLR